MKKQNELEQFIIENKDLLLNFEALKKNFNDKLSDKINKREYINNEIEIVKEKALRPQRLNGLKGLYSNLAEKESYFCKSYENYLYNNEELELSENEFSKYQLIRELNGVTWAKYQIYLINLLNASKEQKQKPFTLVKQLVVLHYLGLSNRIDNASKAAELIAPLIGRDKESTRQKLGELQYEMKDKYLLKEIKEYFIDLGLTEQTKHIENDINRLK